MSPDPLYDAFYGPIRFPEVYEAHMKLLHKIAYNKTQAAFVMGISKRRLNELIRRKRLMVSRITSVTSLVPAESIARFIDKHYVPARLE